jgi:hypothetical protein
VNLRRFLILAVLVIALLWAIWPRPEPFPPPPDPPGAHQIIWIGSPRQLDSVDGLRADPRFQQVLREVGFQS